MNNTVSLKPPESAAAVCALLNTLIDYFKQSRPLKSDQTPLKQSFFYSTMILGMPVNADDFAGPWSPIGGSTLQDAIAKSGLGVGNPALPPGNSTPPVAAPGGTTSGTPTSGASSGTSTASSPSSGGTTAAPAPTGPDPELLRALQAAYKTSVLCDVALQVTSDGSYLEYPAGRHLDFAYREILSGMQAIPAPPIDPGVQASIDAAKKVLYMPDPYDPNGQVDTPTYKRYKANAIAYAQAKANFALQEALALKSASLADAWPMMAAVPQQQVDAAYNALIADAPVIEPALGTLASVGLSLEDAAIGAARRLLDVWNMPFGAVAQSIPYSFVLPSNWCIPNVPDDGFEHLTITAEQYSQTGASISSRDTQGNWNRSSSATGGSGGVSFGFAAFEGGASSSSTNSQWQGSASNTFSEKFANDASGLTVSLSYGLVTIERPWLQPDLFSLNNWYLVGNKAHSISDGTVAGQITQPGLLPALPMQFLVIKNVNISASSWGSDGTLLQQYYGSDQGASQSNASSQQGGGGVCLGFINFGGSAAHSDSHGSTQASSFAQASASSHFGTTFENNTLSIPGAQIIAFVCDIVPDCPKIDDPGLAPAAATKSSGN